MKTCAICHVRYNASLGFCPMCGPIELQGLAQPVRPRVRSIDEWVLTHGREVVVSDALVFAALYLFARQPGRQYAAPRESGENGRGIGMNRTMILLIGGALVLFGASDILSSVTSASMPSVIWGALLVALGVAMLIRSGAKPEPPVSLGAWRADPVGRHELRYWDGSQWTEHVADAGVQSSDPLS